MSVYKALAAASVERGKIELPDGVVYVVRALTVTDMLELAAWEEAGKREVDALQLFPQIVARVTGADSSVIAQLEVTQFSLIVGMAAHGFDAVRAALSAEAAAEGNVPAPRQPSRSTSRSKR